jgi:hypothetical protein
MLGANEELNIALPFSPLLSPASSGLCSEQALPYLQPAIKPGLIRKALVRPVTNVIKEIIHRVAVLARSCLAGDTGCQTV